VLHSRATWRSLVPFRHADASGSVYLALLKGWLHVGSAEWVARAPSVAAVALTAGCVTLLGARLFGRASGLAAGVALASSAAMAGLGREASPLATAVFAATAGTWLFVIALETDRRSVWSAYVVVATASVYVHASCALVLVAHVIALWLDGRHPLRRGVIATAAAPLLAAPAVVQVVASPRRVLEPLRQPGLGDLARALHDASGRNVALLGLAAAGAAALALGYRLRAEAWKTSLVVTWAVLPLVGALTLSIVRPSLDPRYLAVASPALALLAGAGLVALARRELVATAAIVMLAVAGVRLERLERANVEDWPAAVSFAETAHTTDGRIVVAPPRAISAFAFYAGADRGSLAAAGSRVLVVARADGDAAALAAAREAVRAPAYALLGMRRFGSRLQVQTWVRTGVPAPGS
jgi:mannosyltransferase